jgi:hypothetical protein
LLAKFLPSCDENQSYSPGQFLATLCCLFCNLNMVHFFHIQTICLCRHPVRFSLAVWRCLNNRVSFYWSWCPYRLDGSHVPYCRIVSNLRSFLHPQQRHQMWDWIARI